MDKIHCKVCGRRLFDDDSSIAPGIGGYTTCYKTTKLDETLEIDYYLCDTCARNERIQEYQKTKEITSRLWLEATMCNSYEEYNFEGIRDSSKEFYLKNKNVLAEIFNDMEDVTKVMKRFEQDLWLTWIQEYYEKSKDRGHSFCSEDIKVLLWGCAGRVLITIRDAHPQGNPNSKYNGAWISLIFGEDSKIANGGIQGLCATKEEAIGLLNATINQLNSFSPDKEVSVI